MAELPMFPLGSVLLPGMFLPLHVFEPRYLAMVDHCLAGGHEFGVVLIERGREVGGGDVRTSAGTLARIAEARQFADGRWAVAAVGMRRIRVEHWLPDDPYPRAEISEWPDEVCDDDLAAPAEAVGTTLRRVLAMAAELGEPVAPVATLELPDDPVALGWMVAGVAPFGPADRHRVLLATDAAHRLAVLAELLADQEDLLRFRMQDD